jgi:hypothetical protein
MGLATLAFSPPVLNYWDEGYTCPQGFTPHHPVLSEVEELPVTHVW